MRDARKFAQHACQCCMVAVVALPLLWFTPVSHAGMAEDFESAVRRDDESAATTLLLQGANVNMRDSGGVPMLVLAIREESYRVAQLLVGIYALKVEARTPQDESALMLACLRGHEKLVRALIAKGADINKPGWTPLHYAATRGHVHIMKILLEKHAYIDAESPDKTTPLMMAAMYGSTAAVQLLMEAGADVRLLNDQKASALDFAIRGARPDAQRLLEPLLKPQQEANVR